MKRNQDKQDNMTDGPDGGPAHGKSFAGRNPSYQDGRAEDETGGDSGYLGGSPKQSVPPKGGRYQSPGKPVPPGQRGSDAKAFVALQALLASIRQRRSHPGRTAMGPRLTDAKSLEQKTHAPDQGDAATIPNKKPWR
jgi:hypothetical protein